MLFRKRYGGDGDGDDDDQLSPVKGVIALQNPSQLVVYGFGFVYYVDVSLVCAYRERV